MGNIKENLCKEAMTEKEIKNMFANLMEREAGLTENQVNFIKSVYKFWKTTGRLSDRQVFILNEILKYTSPIKVLHNAEK